jgi:hypothetical protein
MLETPLDFDPADASGDRGDLVPLNLKDSKKLYYFRNIGYDAGMVASKGDSAGTRLFGSKGAM